MTYLWKWRHANGNVVLEKNEVGAGAIMTKRKKVRAQDIDSVVILITDANALFL